MTAKRSFQVDRRRATAKCEMRKKKKNQSITKQITIYKVCKASRFICHQKAQICRCSVETEIAFHQLKLNSSTRQAISDKTLKLGKIRARQSIRASDCWVPTICEVKRHERFTIVSLCCCQDLGVIIHALLSSANMFPCGHANTCIYFFITR